MHKLSIIIPCYNEEDGIPQLAEQLPPVIEQLKPNYTVELIFVDDGSTDRTSELIKMHFPSAIILTHEKNKNLGAALRTGFAHATGDLVAALDSDCTYHPSVLPKMLPLLDSNTHIVTVSPYHPQGSVENVPAYRLFLSKSVSAIYRVLLRSHLHTFTAMVRVYKKEVVKNIEINSNTFMGVTEILAKALLRGYKAKEIPVTLTARKFGVSKLKTARAIRDHLKLIKSIAAHKVWGSEL